MCNESVFHTALLPDGNASDSEAKQEGSMCQLAWQVGVLVLV